MRRLVLAVILALSLTAAITGTTLAATSTAPHMVTKTTHGSERLAMPAAQCAKLKAADPAHASDPNLCVMEHSWTETTSGMVTAPNSLTAQASYCGYGWASFHDYYGPLNHIYQLDLDTYFKWIGTCYAPIFGSAPKCYPEWLVSTSLGEQDCYSYNYSGSNWQSLAAVYTAFVTTYIGPIPVSSWDSQRRECYSDAFAHCDWTWWVGR